MYRTSRSTGTHGSRSLVALVVVVGMVLGGLNVGAALNAHAGATAPPEVAATPSTPVASSPGSVPQFRAGSLDLAPPTFDARTPSSVPGVSALPSSLQETPWVANLVDPGTSLHPLVSLPNLDLLEHPVSSVAAAVAPGYVAQPAPLGVADFGLGASPYAVNTTHILGEVTFETPPNVTDPGAAGLVEPAAAGEHNGYLGSPNEFGIQLNTVVQNVTFPGSDQGFFWTQNVVNWNDTAVHFVSDTFNFSYGSFDYLAPGTIYSGCDNSTAGVNEILTIYGGVFQCVGGTIPLSPASYPVTLELFNNATVNAQGRDVVNYSYVLDEAGIGKVYAATYNSVVFNNPAAPHAPATVPAFSINGFNPTPTGLLRDAELDLVGGIGGDNAVFRALNATLQLEYSNQSSGGWGNAPSAYNFGGDTGETSTGIAEYWTPSHDVVAHQGPAMLYGLWNAQPSVSVASGSIQVAGTITPNYGFAFVSNTAPIADEIAAGAPPDNLSWMPTNARGQFDTYLPPLGAPWASQYYVQAFAPEAQEVNGTPITGAVTGYSLVLPPAPGQIDAPLYMFSDAQAADLAFNVSGSAVPPLTFSSLVVSTNLSFNGLNDYGYPSFEIFMAQGIDVPLVASDLVQGNDAPTGNYYLYDGPSGPGGLLYPGPPVLGPFPYYTSQVNIYFSSGPTVTNQEMIGSPNQGGEIVLWRDASPVVRNVASVDDAQGVWVGDSTGATVVGVGVGASLGVQDIGSVGTTIRNLTVGEGGIGFEGYSSTDATIQNVTIYAYSAGVFTGGEFRLGSGSAAAYYDLPGSRGLTVTGLSAVGYYTFGGNISLSSSTTLTDFSVDDGFAGISLDTDTATSISAVTCTELTFCVLSYDDPASLTHLSVTESEYGVVLLGGVGTVVTSSVFYNCAFYAVLILNGTGNHVYDNSFSFNDGSTNAYSTLAVQAYAVRGNYFNSSAGVGNYWSDWPSSSPYVISPYVSDLYPLATGGPGTYSVTFSQTGLPAVDLWQISLFPSGELFAPGSQGSMGAYLPNGSYEFFVSTNDTRYGPSYTVAAFHVSGASVLTPTVTFQSVIVTFTETGLPAKTLAKDGWTVVLNGTRKHAFGAVLSFRIGEGNFGLLVTGPSGYTSNAHGSISLGATPRTIAVTFTKGRTVTLTFAQKGIRTGHPLCVSVNDFSQCTEGTHEKFTNLTAGTYNYSVTAPAANVSLRLGKTPESLSGSLDVAHSEKLVLTHRFTYAVTFTEDGLSSGTWSVKVGKVTETAAWNATIVFTGLGNGTYAYRIGSEPGFTSSGIPAKKVLVAGANAGVTVAFARKG